MPEGTVRVVMGGEARPSAYRASQPGRFALLHFAAHAEASPENPLDSSVILAREGQE